ncbi:TIR domain-containing protein, partial [Pyxidicoccus sp. 3LFB2]
MSTTPSLFGEALRAAAVPWLEELGRSDRERLEGLLGLAVRGQIRLSDCLAALFPGMETRKAQTALTSFRKRLNDAAKGEGRADLGLRFHVDSNKQSPPTERFCWFTGPDPAVMQAERYSEQLTADIKGRPYVRTKGIATTESASAPGSTAASGKRPVRFFVSYAHANNPFVQALLKELRQHFASSARYEFQAWSDQAILVGERWKQSIEKALEDCDFGLLLISPAFLASGFIGKHELPLFVESQGKAAPKPVLPVGLVRVSFERHDTKGLGEHQFFLLQGERLEGRYYEEMGSGPRKSRFAYELFIAIEKRLDAVFGPTQGPPTSPRGPDRRQPDSFADCVPMPDPTHGFQRPRARGLSLGDQERLDAGDADLTEHLQARDALNELEAWAKNTAPGAPPFFALLGEYGIGKTTTLKQFTRHLLDARQSDPGLPLPIYVDLRDYTGGAGDGDPTIGQLLSSAIQRSWKLRDRTITPDDVLRLVQEEGAIILFDGLDEQLVHLPPDRARRFIRTLWSVLPDATRDSGLAPPGKRRGKLLVSCRSHYFRDVWSQNAMLVGEDREGFDRNRFPALYLLPFTEEQIRGYLTSLLTAPERVEEAFGLIASIHNLHDLAKRPYLLTLISGQLGQLEKLRARGEEVNAARLYDLIVRSWLNRDDGKHQLDPVHKRRLMEELAAALWRSDTKQWDVERLEDWFDEYLAGNPALAAAYANKDRTVLKEDLRTATFVLRPTTEEKQEEKYFRFAHTSLQEYFLASYLMRALVEGKVDRWSLPGVSQETLDFLGQVLALESQQSAALRSLETILGGEQVQAAVLGFAYWLRALTKGFPAPTPARVNLAGANLEEWHLRGRGPTQPLNLRNANLSNVRLNRARIEYVNLAGANLSAMAARQALFLKVSAPNACSRDVDLRGVKWREGSLVGTDFTGAQLSGCQWIHVDLGGATLPEGWERLATAVQEPLGGLPSQNGAPVPAAFLGHASAVRACAWSPDGQRLLSSADDNTLKVWDAGSGECLLTLSG